MPLNGANTDGMEHATREMIEGRMAWPNYPTLPMKCRDGREIILGRILHPVGKEIVILIDHSQDERLRFKSVNDLLTAGWVVD